MNKILLLAFLVLSVICVINGDHDDGYDWDVNRSESDRQPISATNAAIHARLRRAFRGTYNEKSRTQKKYHRQVLRHKMSTDPEGRVSIDTEHHHEKGGSSERSRKAGNFALHNNDNGQDNGWFNDNQDDDF